MANAIRRHAAPEEVGSTRGRRSRHPWVGACEPCDTSRSSARCSSASIRAAPKYRPAGAESAHCAAPPTPDSRSARRGNRSFSSLAAVDRICEETHLHVLDERPEEGLRGGTILKMTHLAVRVGWQGAPLPPPLRAVTMRRRMTPQQGSSGMIGASGLPPAAGGGALVPCGPSETPPSRRRPWVLKSTCQLT